MEPVVVAAGVEKRYGETAALCGVSLSIDAGEVFGLIGPNGAGKTTLVRALTGTVEPDAGTVSLLGTDPERAERDRLGVLPQAFAPHARLTASELLSYYAGLYPSARDPDAVLADVGLTDAADAWYENLSGGQQRRLCVGTALVNDPDVLVLDEPTTGIDPAGRRTVWQLIEELASGGATVVLTTHDMAEAERLADRVGLLSEGRLVAQGTPASLVDQHAGPSRLTVELASGVESDDHPGRRLADALAYPVDVREDAIVVRGVEPEDVGSIAAALDDADVAYAGLSWAEPGLEDVYLALAGDVEAAATGRVDGRTDPRDALADGGDRR